MADGVAALVLADGDVDARADLDVAWPGWYEGIGLVVAADGGARHAAGLGLTIDQWVGDGDSIDPATLDTLRASGVPIELHARDKDQSDTELAIAAAVAGGATAVTVLGAFGGERFDHTIVNLTLLAHPALGGRPASLLSASTRVRLARAPGADGGAVEVALPGRLDDLVSIIPIGTDATGIRTEGLRYPLNDESLVFGSARGLSNVRIATDARFSIRAGSVLVVETPVTLSP